jgi:hypothetical protein
VFQCMAFRLRIDNFSKERIKLLILIHLVEIRPSSSFMFRGIPIYQFYIDLTTASSCGARRYLVMTDTTLSKEFYRAAGYIKSECPQFSSL